MIGNAPPIPIEKDRTWVTDESRKRLVNAAYFTSSQQQRYLANEFAYGLRPDMTVYGQHIFHRKLNAAVRLRSAFHEFALKENMRASLYSPLQNMELNKVVWTTHGESV